jgi:hypothetical protein
MALLASDFDQSKYWKAADLPHEKKFRIKHVTEEQIGLGPDKERKLVVWFTSDQRGLVLNRTNNRAIRGAYGDNTDGWVGKIVVIFSTLADFRGKMTPAVRVRIPPPKQAAAAAATPLQQPVTSGNGAAPAPAGLGAAAVPLAAAAAAAPLAVAALAAADAELEPDPVKPIRDELDDEIPW